MSNAIHTEGLRFCYRSLPGAGTAPWVLDGADLRVEESERLAVMGANDSGKTTLTWLLSGLAPWLTGGIMEGRVVVAGRDTRQNAPPALASVVGVVFQEPEAQLFNPTVEAEVAWGLENLGVPPAEIRVRVSQALGALRLAHARNRSPSELSGGEKKRLALATVLAMQPAVLILDEPMGGLDPVGREEVLAALGELRDQRSAAIVMTESDPEAAAAFSDRLVVLAGGAVAREGTALSLFQQAERLWELGVAVPQMARLARALNERLGSAFRFLTEGQAESELRQHLLGRERGFAAEPPAPRQPATHAYAGHVRQAPAEAAVCLEGLWFSYGDGAPVLRGVDLAVSRGESVALVGANGSGKTTLIKHLNGLLRPRKGRVWVGGQDAAGRSVGELARQVGFLFQHPEQQIFGATVFQEIAFGPRNLGLGPSEVAARVEAALDRFGLAQVADRPPAILSYGLRRQVTLATLFAMDPPVLVLDEPTVGLDARGRAETVRWLEELRNAGRTVILVTHDMALVAEVADRVVVLEGGRMAGDGPPAALFQEHSLLQRASLAAPPVSALRQALRPHGLSGEGLSVEQFCTDYAALVQGQA